MSTQTHIHKSQFQVHLCISDISHLFSTQSIRSKEEFKDIALKLDTEVNERRFSAFFIYGNGSQN